MKNPNAEKKKQEILSQELPYEILVQDIKISMKSYDVYPPGGLALEIYKLIEQGILNCRDKTILDLGCGSGIVSIAAARFGAKHVVALDIVEACVEATHSNALLNHVKNIIEARISNGLASLSRDEQFDVIIYIAPQDDSVPENGLDYAFYDPSFNLLHELAEKAKDHLRPNGKIILAYMDHNMERMPLDQIFVGSKTRILNRIGKDLSLVEITYPESGQ